MSHSLNSLKGFTYGLGHSKADARSVDCSSYRFLTPGVYLFLDVVG